MIKLLARRPAHRSLPAAPATSDHSSLEHEPTQAGRRHRTFTGRVWAWGLWDMGSAAFNAVVTTFVFSVYLTNEKLFGPHADTDLGYALTVAGVAIAVVAPALGQAIDRSGRSASFLRATTAITIVCTTGLFWVTPIGPDGSSRLWLGLFLLAVGNISFETGSVIYNAMLSEVSTPRTVGRISGFGWGLGYVGGIVLLLILFVGFINPDVGWFGVTSENGLNIRVAMLFAALWTLIFSLPIAIVFHDKPRTKAVKHLGVVGAYKELAHSLKRLWNIDRSVVWFLLSSAIYRDGLAGVFTFGAILASTAFGFSSSQVILFGVVANVVAGIATMLFGFLDDLLGARAVIIISLVAMCVFGFAVFFFHSGIGSLSPTAIYWIFGLGLCIFVGPTQSASRTYLSRIAPPGEEGEVFGLYATTGRAVSFLAPFMYATAISIARHFVPDAEYFGILGLMVVLLAGLLAFLPVKAQPRHTPETAHTV
ncbi:MAG: MFS transporter [Arcanobacterium sp.]|nr:MFS transporter [Arcanobacterium sp.]MDY5588763.1 MFS transporter [Arcanobacterium sp.]